MLPAALAFSMAFGAMSPAFAQAPTNAEIERRQRMKNEWRNIAAAAGLLAVIGLLKDDGTLTFVGTTGALYSLHRYEQDRKSHDRLRRLRAEFFSRPYFYRNGVRFNRRTTVKNGKRYYYFVKAK